MLGRLRRLGLTLGLLLLSILAACISTATVGEGQECRPPDCVMLEPGPSSVPVTTEEGATETTGPPIIREGDSPRATTPLEGGSTVPAGPVTTETTQTAGRESGSAAGGVAASEAEPASLEGLVLVGFAAVAFGVGSLVGLALWRR